MWVHNQSMGSGSVDGAALSCLCSCQCPTGAAAPLALTRGRHNAAPSCCPRGTDSIWIVFGFSSFPEVAWLMLRLFLLPSAAEEGFPLRSPARICAQIPVSSQLVAQQSKLVGFGVTWAGWGHWGAEQILLVFTCHSECHHRPAAALPPYALASFPFVLALPFIQTLGMFCCSHVPPVLCPLPEHPDP